MNLRDKGSGSEDMMRQRERENSESQLKTCVDCGTTKTPLWRGGPAGPKSLCNACGIRSRKKRRALVGLDKKLKKSSENKNQCSNTSTSSSGDSTSSSSNGSLLLPFGRQVVALQRPRSRSSSRPRSRSRSTHKLGEVEQAAILLMALSCASVYA
ncbi:GATA transcription factor 15 [Nicotiana tabacum]|uniref:GATA transcription factor 15 n=1 Tax=Nicotiana tabacum TaxID=4097 RepID=A0A1S4C3K8_TOBAC|nr:PREDICTED: GATA transcription factor 16-like [Nicotiana tabacum]